MAATAIEWTDHAINPIRARRKYAGDHTDEAVGHYCEKISAGCANCYASALQKRFQMPEFGSAKNRGNVEVYLDEKKLDEVLRRRKPTKYLWCDMTDMFGEWVPFEWIDRCFATMALTPHHIHQVLTKRPQRMAEYMVEGRDAQVLVHLNVPQGCRLGQWYEGPIPWPLPNVWIGTSVENQAAADERIPHLLRCPAAIRFLSVEPMLGPVDLREALRNHNGGDYWAKAGGGDRECEHGIAAGLTCYECRGALAWVIVGGESGHHVRPCDVAWIRSIRDQCQAAGVPVFIKQLGANVIDSEWGKRPHHVVDCQCGFHHGFNDRKGGDMEEWPQDLRVRQFPSGVALTSRWAIRKA